MRILPAGVSGIRVSGRVTAEDFRRFKPALNTMLDSDEIRFVEVIGPDYEGFGPGGLLADIKQGFSTMTHLRAFKRTAVVTEIDADYDGDAFAPTLSPAWREVQREPHMAASGLRFAFVTYEQEQGI